MFDSYSSFEDSFEFTTEKQAFSPGSSSTPKKSPYRYKSPEMPEIRRRSNAALDTSMLCQMNTAKKAPKIVSPKMPEFEDLETTEKIVRKLPKPVFGLEEKFECKICSKSFYHQSALQVHVLLHTSTLPRKQIAKAADKVKKLQRNPSRDSGHASAEESPLPRQVLSPSSPVNPDEKYIHRFELNLTSLDEKLKKKSKSTKQYACSMCGKGFNKKTSMRIHQTKRHVHTREFLIFV